MYDPAKPYKHEILRLIESTWQTPHVRVRAGGSRFFASIEV